MRLVLVGVNPQLRTVAVHAHFALSREPVLSGRPVGRCRQRWSTPRRDSRGFDRGHLVDPGVGITRRVAWGAERADELGRDELVAGAAALGPTTPAPAGSRAPQTDARCGSTPDPVGHYLGGRHGAFPAGRPIVSLDGMGRRWCRRCEE